MAYTNSPLVNVTLFYYSKAKVENRIKLMRQYKVAPQEQHFSDNF